MKTMLRTFTAILTLLVVAYWRHWHEPFQLVVGGMALPVIIIAVFLWKKSRQEEGVNGSADTEEATESPFRAAFFGIVTGTLTCLLLAGVFAGASRIQPLVRLFEGQQRKEFEVRVKPIMEAGNHEQAIKLIQAQVAVKNLSADWQADLAGKLYNELIEASQTATNFNVCSDRLQQAVNLAQKSRLDGRLAADLLENAKAAEKTRVHLVQMKAEHRWSELVPVLQDAINTKQREKWELPYDRWLYDVQVDWAKEASDPKSKKQKLESAIEIARGFKLDPSVAEARLKTVDEEELMDARIEDAQKRAQVQSRKEIDRLNATVAQTKRQKELAEQQTESIKEEARLAQQRTALQARYEGLLAAGDSFSDPDPRANLEHKIHLYSQAEAFALTNRLDRQPATLRMRQTSGELENLLAQLQRDARPVDLPAHCGAEVVRVSLEHSPYVLLSLYVTNSAGEPVRGLQQKDFRILCEGLPPRMVQVASVATQPPQIHLVLCLDESGSMRGRPLNEAKAAAREMLLGLAREARVSVLVIAFSDRVRTLCDWTTNLAVAAVSIDQLKPGGETALFAAASHAADELRQRAGERRLVLFTDGCDNASPRGLTAASLAGRLRTDGTETYAIGLRDADLDSATLRRLADHYFEAKGPQDIRSVFQNAGANLIREAYRFVITPDPTAENSPRLIQITVGRANAVTVEHRLQATPVVASAR